jgi:hypothetical protein
LRNLEIHEIKERKIIESFANALEIIPKILLTNAGFNAFEEIEKWKFQQFNSPDKFIGVDFKEYPLKYIDPMKCGLIDSLRVKIQQIHLSVETLSVLLNLDGIIKAENLNDSNQVSMEDFQLPKERDWKYQRFQSTDATSKWTKEKKLKYKNQEDKFYEKQKEDRKKNEKLMVPKKE